MFTLLQDLRYALRRLRQSPGFAVVCVITLALGIGANTAIFTLVDAVILKSLPVANPSQLYRLGNDNNCCVIGGFQDDWGIYSYSLYQQFRDHTPEFAELAAFQGGLANLSVRRSGTSGPAEPYAGEFVSGNYFSMFGLSAFAGRIISPADDTPSAPAVAVMSYRTWLQHFALDPSVIGATFNINQMPYTVAGIAPPGFFGDTLRPDPPDFWLPLATEPAFSSGQTPLLNNPSLHWLYTIGRVALGAPRFRLIRQIITESVLLATLGGLIGLCVAFAGTRMILLLVFRGARYVPISAAPSLPVLGFAFALSLVTGIVFGAVPAWITSRSNPAETLRGMGRSTRDRSSLPRKSLVVLQVALSAILLIGAGLLTQTLRNLENQLFGFEPQGRLVVRVNPALAGYKLEGLYGLYQQLEQSLPRIPGVISASYSLYSPMRGDNWSLGIQIEGRPPADRDNGASFDRVGPRYFETIGTRLLRGRVIGHEDTPTSRYVALINQTFASKFFPKEDPLGKHWA